MAAVKLLFVVQRPPYKSENPRLALTMHWQARPPKSTWMRVIQLFRPSHSSVTVC